MQQHVPVPDVKYIRTSTQLKFIEKGSQIIPGWLKEKQYTKTNQMIKVNEIKKQ